MVGPLVSGFKLRGETPEVGLQPGHVHSVFLTVLHVFVLETVLQTTVISQHGGESGSELYHCLVPVLRSVVKLKNRTLC